ncbi:calcium binding protein [Anaeramoeba ignava]|uniref:Calcium binding protein n=1 Tax=Anaeramoeba ignava TaxID=1746090 RepID=A0A9Q0LJP6_ANAIG|nr:calcium binding protein [Anaeramoeba ignava]|eukprot:Anaeramoba_ignava/a7_829.p1 GENE.a7_829~~a7_829.p1  ORF type:complete len:221 (+),score=80.14 a7_829:13-675(+)
MENKKKKKESPGITKKGIKALKASIKKIVKGDPTKCHLTAKHLEELFGLDENGAKLLHLVMDSDGNGTVEFKELLSAMTILSSESDEQKAEMLFDLWDADGNGTLDKNEVMQMIHSTIVVTANILMNEHLKSVKTMRNMKDAQKGGEEDTKKLIQANISREEVQQIVDQMFDEVDVNQDGVLSKEEFRAHCKSSNNATAQFVSGLQDILKPQKGGGCSIF